MGDKKEINMDDQIRTLRERRQYFANHPIEEYYSLNEDEQKARDYLIKSMKKKHPRPITCKDVCKHIGLPECKAYEGNGGFMGHLLGHVAYYEAQHNRPMLSVCVINQVTGMSGSGFFDLATNMGLMQKGEANDLFWAVSWHECVQYMKEHPDYPPYT